jgi:hypothetical protein
MAFVPHTSKSSVKRGTRILLKEDFTDAKGTFLKGSILVCTSAQRGPSAAFQDEETGYSTIFFPRHLEQLTKLAEIVKE